MSNNDGYAEAEAMLRDIICRNPSDTAIRVARDHMMQFALSRTPSHGRVSGDLRKALEHIKMDAEEALFPHGPVMADALRKIAERAEAALSTPAENGEVLQNRHRRSDNAGLSRFWPIGWVILSSLSGLKWVQRFKAHPSAVVAVVITIRAGKLCHQRLALTTIA